MTAGTRIQPATPELKALMDDLKFALGKHTNLSAMQMLAVVSQFLGSIVAFQDGSRFNAEQVMEIVGANIEIGNQVALDSVLGKPQGRA